MSGHRVEWGHDETKVLRGKSVSCKKEKIHQNPRAVREKWCRGGEWAPKGKSRNTAPTCQLDVKKKNTVCRKKERTMREHSRKGKRGVRVQ